MAAELNYNKGNVPTIFISAKTIPEAWQKAMVDLWEKGMDVPTSFDAKGDPKSKDATVLIEVQEPFAEPRFHKNFPASFESLEHYRLEVTHGVHDHWIERFGTKWNYTYHERLRNYDSGDGKKIDQLENMMAIIENKVKEARKKGEDLDITNRRFQIITWIPNVDPFIIDPPCLQRLHFRLAPEDETEKSYKLNLNTSWRSRDGYKGWLMNVEGMTQLQRIVAEELSERTDLNIKVGRYTDISDSLHIYGKYFYKNGNFAEFYDKTKKVPIEDMVFNTADIKDILIEGRRILKAQLDYESKTGEKGKFDPKLSESEVRANYPYPAEWDK